MKKSSKNRRQFLRNVSLTALSLGVIPSLSAAKPKNETPIADQLNCPVSTLDFYGAGPFYTNNPPVLSNGQLASSAEPGVRMIISGRIRSLDCMLIIPDAEVDIWQADDSGDYDNVGYNLRGVTKSNSQGFYLFETIKPGKYLNGGDFRPSHIHFKITPPNFPTLTTQLYFEGDSSIPGDAAASLTSGTFDASHRIIPLTTNSNGVLEGTWDIVIDGNGISSSNDIHIDKGMIYRAAPNPFDEKVKIRYGVFKRSRIGLKVYDSEGRLVSLLEERELSADKYDAIWRPEGNTPNGHYFIVLQVNDIQVHHLKVVLARS